MSLYVWTVYIPVYTEGHLICGLWLWNMRLVIAAASYYWRFHRLLADWVNTLVLLSANNLPYTLARAKCYGRKSISAPKKPSAFPKLLDWPFYGRYCSIERPLSCWCSLCEYWILISMRRTPICPTHSPTFPSHPIGDGDGTACCICKSRIFFPFTWTFRRAAAIMERAHCMHQSISPTSFDYLG